MRVMRALNHDSKLRVATWFTSYDGMEHNVFSNFYQQLNKFNVTYQDHDSPFCLNQRQHARPAILCCFRPVAGAVVGIEGVWRVGIDDDLGFFARRFDCLAHLLDRIRGDALVRAAVEAEHRCLEVGNDIEGIARRVCVRLTDSRPYQATPAFRSALCAA